VAKLLHVTLLAVALHSTLLAVVRHISLLDVLVQITLLAVVASKACNLLQPISSGATNEAKLGNAALVVRAISQPGCLRPPNYCSSPSARCMTRGGACRPL
jgi:hypothetical protein